MMPVMAGRNSESSDMSGDSPRPPGPSGRARKWDYEALRDALPLIRPEDRADTPLDSEGKADPSAPPRKLSTDPPSERRGFPEGLIGRPAPRMVAAPESIRPSRHREDVRRRGHPGDLATDRPGEGAAIREVIENLGKVTAALHGIVISWDAAMTELALARATGRAAGISEHDLSRVAGARPELEQVLGRVTRIRDSAVRGSEPSPIETANLSVQLAGVSSAAERVQQEIPRSSVWQKIRTGFKSVFRGLAQVLVSLPNMEVKEMSVTLSGGLPPLVQGQITIVLTPPAPPAPAEASGRAAAPEPPPHALPRPPAAQQP
jgi:hypothetical protein